jgi:hypothetical protein
VKLARTIFSTLVCGGITSVAGFAVAETSEPVVEQTPAIVQIVAVQASKEPIGMDSRLDSIKNDLRQLPFRGYALIGARACTLRDGDRCGMRIDDEGYLQIRTTGTTSEFLKLHLLFNRRNRPVVNADLKLNRKAAVLLTSSRIDGGTLVLSIKLREYPVAADVVSDATSR